MSAPRGGQAGGAAALRTLPEERFPRLASAVSELVAELRPLESGVGAFHLHGSFVRACITGEAFADVDVVARTSAGHAALAGRSARPLAIRHPVTGRPVTVRLDVNRAVVEDADELLAATEFSVAQIAYSWPERCVRLAPDALEHLAARVLVPLAAGVGAPVHRIVRVLRYVERGYRCDADGLLDLLRRYCRRPRYRREAEAWVTRARVGEMVAGAPRHGGHA